MCLILQANGLPSLSHFCNRKRSDLSASGNAAQAASPMPAIQPNKPRKPAQMTEKHIPTCAPAREARGRALMFLMSKYKNWLNENPLSQTQFTIPNYLDQGQWTRAILLALCRKQNIVEDFHAKKEPEQKSQWWKDVWFLKLFIRAASVLELSSKMHSMAFALDSLAFGFTESFLSSMFHVVFSV